jgi:hypothetical protein
MEGFKTMDRSEYMTRMQVECRQIMGQIADAVNNAPTGNVISGSEMQVRDLMEKLRQKSFELAVQMRVDSHESTFSPSGRGGESAGEQRTIQPQRDDVQRPDQLVAKALCRRGIGKRMSGGHADR